MKTTRRILTMALALILTLALALPAFAAGEKGTITVTRPTGATGTGETYKVFQIFNTNPVVGGHTYQLTDEWKSFTAADYFSVNENDYVVWEKNTTSAADAAAVAQLAKQYVVDNSLTTTRSVTAGAAALEVDPGYYLLVPENGPCGVIMVEAGEDATVEEKTTATGHPTVEKLVYEDSTKTYKNFNSVDIGQTVMFQTTITAGVGAEKYVLHDKMDAHFEYTNDFSLFRDGNELDEGVYYTINENPTDGCTFHVDFTENLCKDLNENAKVVVQYTAKLKGEATVGGQVVKTETGTGYKNTTWLTYRNDVPSNESFTQTATFKVTVTKTDDANNKLAGAGFLLRDNINKYYKVDPVTGEVSWVGLDENPTELITDASGVVEFVGVDAENFILVEKTVPNGYTGATDESVSTKQGDQGDGKNDEITIVNVLGEALPETGGIGTTVFYILGGLMVVGALILLTVSKRRSNAQ